MADEFADKAVQMDSYKPMVRVAYTQVSVEDISGPQRQPGMRHVGDSSCNC